MNKRKLSVGYLIVLVILNYACLTNINTGRQLMHLEKNIVKMLQAHVAASKSGTKWCGSGSTAESYDDLGPERETDKCCRAHDYCPDYIVGGATNYNLTNDAFYTRLSCDCDNQFRECLRATNRRVANNIGVVYFNFLGTKCFRNDYPVEKCVKKGGWLKRKCVEYIYNMTEEKRYQWFDVVDY